MSAFILFDIRDVRDPGKLGEYKARVLKTVEAHGGTYRVLGGPAEAVEGDLPMATPVLIEFPSREAALSWHGSEDYRPLLQLRSEAADCAALLIEGCAHPPAGMS